MTSTLPPSATVVDEVQRRASAAYAAVPNYSGHGFDHTSVMALSDSPSSPLSPSFPTGSGSGTPPPIDDTPLDHPDFYVSELTRALYEIQFGVKRIGAVVPTSTSSLAKPGSTAEVELLEGRTIKIKLTLSGYKVNYGLLLSFGGDI